MLQGKTSGLAAGMQSSKKARGPKTGRLVRRLMGSMVCLAFASSLNAQCGDTGPSSPEGGDVYVEHLELVMRKVQSRYRWARAVDSNDNDRIDPEEIQAAPKLKWLECEDCSGKTKEASSMPPDEFYESTMNSLGPELACNPP